jgi:hypothetical protein
MLNNRWLLHVGLLSLASGCTVDVAPPPEQLATESQALGSSYSQAVDLANQALVFTAPSGTTRVDVYLTINGARAMSVRMAPSGSSYRLGPIALEPGDQLSYAFTYLVGSVQTTTPTFQTTVPLTFQPGALLPRVDTTSSAGKYVIHLVSSAAILWADVHYTVNGGTQQNIRMSSSGTEVLLNAGDDLVYSMTYATGSWVFNSASYEYVPTAAGVSYNWFAQKFPSDPGTGCDPNGPPFSCSPDPFSKIGAYGGYQSTATTLPLVPIVPMGANTTYQQGWFNTLSVGFAYTGGTPRNGTGLALIPTSTAGAGGPPSTGREALLGKNLSAVPALASSFLIGGGGMAVALVDVNGLWSNQVDVTSYTIGCQNGDCIFFVPMNVVAQGSPVDLTQVRYVVFVTESGATTNPSVMVGDITFDNILGG